MRDILNSYTTTELRKFISTYNKSLGAVRGYSKMKKADLVNLMTKKEHIDKFKSIKMKPKTERTTTKTATKTTTKTQPKKQTTTTPKEEPKKEDQETIEDNQRKLLRQFVIKFGKKAVARKSLNKKEEVSKYSREYNNFLMKISEEGKKIKDPTEFIKTTNKELLKEFEDTQKNFRETVIKKLKSFKTPPKQQTTTTKTRPKQQFTFGVITKEKINPDFNFTRNFDYKTKKTKDGYEWTFKNQDDYDTAWDITSFIPEYKDTRRFKWYEKTPYTEKIFILQEKLKQFKGELNEMNRDPAIREPRGSKKEKIKALKNLEKRFNKIKTSSQKIINDFKKKNKIPDNVIQNELKEGNYLYNIDTIPKFIKTRLDKLK